MRATRASPMAFVNNTARYGNWKLSDPAPSSQYRSGPTGLAGRKLGRSIGGLSLAGDRSEMMVIQGNAPVCRQLSDRDRRFISDGRFCDVRSNGKAWDSLPEILQRLINVRRCLAASIAIAALLIAACSPSDSGASAGPKEEGTGSTGKVSADGGARLFIQCKACHALESDAGPAVGPNLSGILGSRAGTRESFDYSAAMKEADLIWTRETLDRFLASPNEVVEGTSMTFAGIADPQQRETLIEYISRYSE